MKNSMKKDRISFLEKQIRHHRDLYYNAVPEIADSAYDAIEEELRKIDPNNPILLETGTTGRG